MLTNYFVEIVAALLPDIDWTKPVPLDDVDLQPTRHPTSLVL